MQPGKPHVVHAEPHVDHTLTLTFENGEVLRFDMKPYLDSEVFQRLHDLNLFVRPTSGTAHWSGRASATWPTTCSML